jgi:hypothetical protein
MRSFQINAWWAWSLCERYHQKYWLRIELFRARNPRANMSQGSRHYTQCHRRNKEHAHRGDILGLWKPQVPVDYYAYSHLHKAKLGDPPMFQWFSGTSRSTPNQRYPLGSTEILSSWVVAFVHTLHLRRFLEFQVSGCWGVGMILATRERRCRCVIKVWLRSWIQCWKSVAEPATTLRPSFSRNWSLLYRKRQLKQRPNLISTNSSTSSYTICGQHGVKLKG